MQDFRKLAVWQKAHELALLTYRITANFPKDEVFGLRHMMRKTSIDIPAFIAEGCGKPNDMEFAKAMNAGIATNNRLEYYAVMARDLEFINTENHQAYENAIIEVRRMITGLNRRLASSAVTSHN